MPEATQHALSSGSSKRRKGVWTSIALSALIAIVALVIVAAVVIHRASPILKGRVIETLSTRFDSRVEIDGFHVSVLRGLDITGDHLRIYPPDDVVAAGVHEPLIALEHFSFHSGLIGLFFKPMHVRAVQITGLQINIPPRERRQAPQQRRKHGGKIKISVDEVICDNSRLIIGTAKPDKDPKDFELRHVELHDLGPNAPWQYDATLVNAIPRGDIHATGTFGPWQTNSPGDSSVTGHYIFDGADLNTIKGIGGVLSSVGNFKGQLDKIVVDGTTETPDFSLDTARHPIPLHTQFHAIVDGISGDTYLRPVNAKLRNSRFTTSGAVISVKGKGHIINLDVDVPNGQVQDFLDLAVKTEPAIMTGDIRIKAKLYIRPGKESVSKKLSFAGNFTLQNIHFSNWEIQDKVDMLSLRARGEPKKAKPGARDVDSQMTGRFSMREGVLRLSELVYVLPGAKVSLAGIYSLDDQQFDMHGTLQTRATLSQMVESWWKSWLLKPVSPFFRGRAGGAEIPIKISGTRSKPKFGLDLHFGNHAKNGKRPEK